ncbi:MAG: hypothetical protein NT154_09070 [Verrucomicrobia bacterium]|nr:hypothetical protein [Verrucomicrobiota bacterium]
MNRHSFLYGNDPAKPDGQQLRGQRVYCSSRGQRGGCGQTFSIFLADVLPRHSVTATWLWKLLLKLLAGASLKAAVQSWALPFALETLYDLRQRLRQRMAVLRPLLCRQQKPPPSSDADPLLHTVRHLAALFPKAACPLQEFQLLFGLPLMG